MRTIYLEPKQIPEALRLGYTGNKFSARVTEEVEIPSDAGLWDGGSRDLYHVILLSTGEVSAIPGQERSPWDRGRGNRVIPIRPGYAVVRHTIFCGKDLGLTFYVHPQNAATFLPPKIELDENEQIVLQATRDFKSSYGGRDRYQMAAERAHWSGRPVPSRVDWEVAKARLIDRKLLTKMGAITPAGRNALED